MLAPLWFASPTTAPSSQVDLRIQPQQTRLEVIVKIKEFATPLANLCLWRKRIRNKRHPLDLDACPRRKHVLEGCLHNIPGCIELEVCGLHCAPLLSTERERVDISFSSKK
jgi:hypothetical protein